jgi:hypothetical protein
LRHDAELLGEVTLSIKGGTESNLEGGTMTRFILLLILLCAGTVMSSIATARHSHHAATTTYWYRPVNDPNAVFVGGTYAGSDPDPNIRAALIREFGRRR